MIYVWEPANICDMKSSLFAKRLKEAREARGLSQEALAKAINMSRFTVLDWEMGRRSPSLLTIYTLSEILSVSLDYFLEKEESRVTRYFKEMPDGSLVPVDSAAGSLEEVLAENPDLEVWFRTRKLSEEEKSQIAALLLQIKKQWEAEDQAKEEG